MGQNPSQQNNNKYWKFENGHGQHQDRPDKRTDKMQKAKEGKAHEGQERVHGKPDEPPPPYDEVVRSSETG